MAVLIEHLLQLLNRLAGLLQLYIQLFDEVFGILGNLDILLDEFFAAELLLDLADVEDVVD